MAKVKKQPRPKAETPKGFRDYFGTEVSERSEMLSQIAGVYHHYGFDALESSAVETVEALGKFLPDVDRPNEGVFAWQEEEGDWLALRYDLTAPLARVYAQHRNDLPNPYRRYAMGPVWRNEKPDPGAIVSFINAMRILWAHLLSRQTVKSARCWQTLGNRRYPTRRLHRACEQPQGFEWCLETMGLADDTQRDAVLRTIDKFDKVGEAGVRELLGKGRLDASGAYIDGVGLSDDQAAPVVAF